MDDNTGSLDALIADIKSCIAEPEAEAGPAQNAPEKKAAGSQNPDRTSAGKTRRAGLRAFGRICAKVGIFLLVTVLLTATALYSLMYVVARGPSPSAAKLFVMSVRETSAVGFLANLFFSDAQIAAMEGGGQEEEYADTDTNLIQITTLPKQDEDTPSPQGPVPDAWGLVDEDGDGIIVEEVKGEGYCGYMMVVLDPSRVIMGSHPSSYGGVGYTVASMVKSFGAVAGINAGGFDDPGGHGNGSVPDSMVVFEGRIYFAEKGAQDGFVGFDSNHIMHVGKLTPEQIRKRNIQYGVSFGPVLISNGEPVNTKNLASGINPRTAIGQRSDGAVLLLVIDGRQVISLGATYQDLVDIFLSYGAVNACNLDGGSSSLMWYDGHYLNNSASVVGIRPVPTTFLVLPEGVEDHG